MTQNRIITAIEVGDIEKTAFWRKYTEMLDGLLEQNVRDLKTAGDDKYRQLQGRIFALEQVKSLPKRIVEGLIESENSTPNRQ